MADVRKTYIFYAELTGTEANNTPTVMSGDAGVRILVYITRDSAPVNLTGMKRVHAAFTRPGSAAPYIQDLTTGVAVDDAEGGRVRIDADAAAFSGSAGIVQMDLLLYDAADGAPVVSVTGRIQFNVRLPIESNDALLGNTNMPVLVALQEDLENALKEQEGQIADTRLALGECLDVTEAARAEEAVRAAAETIRLDAESGRSAAESARVAAENERANAERGRASAEGERAGAEAARAGAEDSRAGAEALRESAEIERAGAEESRRGAEGERVVAEAARAGAEESRAAAESSRVQAENERQALWGGLTVSADTLAPGSEAYAELDRQAKTLTFGVPEGQRGGDGSGVLGGGADGQIMVKNGTEDYALRWVTPDKAMVGLGNADNTTDADKPVSAAQAARFEAVEGRAAQVENRATALEDRASTLESRAKAVEDRASALESTRALKTRQVTVTLTTAGWTGDAAPYQQAVSAAGMTADTIGVVAPDYASMDAYGKAGIAASAQAANSVTFTAKKLPTTDVVAIITILG